MMIKQEKKSSRTVVLCIILALILAAYSVRLFSWQIVHNSDYVNQSLSTTATYTSIPAARGEILDRYGRPFAVNTEGYSISFNRIYLPDSRLNAVILTLTSLLSSAGEEWVDSCPLSHSSPYEFDETATISPTVMRAKLALNDYATAQNCWDAMVESFGLSEYSDEQKRTIMGVRLTMLVADYADTIPFTFAESVSADTVAKIKESSEILPGVEANIVPVRQYVSGEIATHLIGNTGPIYAEEWSALKDKGYTYSDKVGKLGIEKIAEDTLRGKSGTLKTIRDSSGNVLSTEVVQEPQSGNSVMLTLDRNLQSVAYNSLKNLIAQRNTTESGRNANAGAIVVMNVNTFEVLAAVTYPSYDMDTYMNNYSSLLNASGKPLFNRALNGVYAPGSTFKPATSCAALTLGTITPSETIYCSHTYTYYKDYRPVCTGYHKSVNISTALAVSCNYFFYEVGRRTGISNLNKYCKMLGLGVSTGIELPESTGILAGPDYRESIGSYWTDGDTLQAAIGQSDNGFTPLQMASYISTIANGGTRYSAHIIKETRNYSLSTTTGVTQPKVLDETGFSSEVINTVKQGMLSVTTEGTASGIFKNYSLSVGGKTGTATVVDNGVEYNNGVFVAFAPYENPEIAVVIFVEKGGHGADCARPAQDIFDAYFYYQGEQYTGQQSNTLLP